MTGKIGLRMLFCLMLEKGKGMSLIDVRSIKKLTGDF